MRGMATAADGRVRASPAYARREGTMQQTETAAVRLAEVVAMLSLATDLGTGFAFEHGLGR